MPYAVLLRCGCSVNEPRTQREAACPEGRRLLGAAERTYRDGQHEAWIDARADLLQHFAEGDPEHDV